jgi:cytidine deaminase
MVLDGAREIVEVAVIAGGPHPVPPCGGCRQKLLEFGKGDTKVTMATTGGAQIVMTLAELLPGAFDASHMG